MTIEEQPTPRRRRVAPPVTDPMAPTVPNTPVASIAAPDPVPEATPARQEPTPGSEAVRTPAAPAPAAPRRKARSEPTVPVFVRTGTSTKEHFEDLAAAAGLSQREMFEQLVEQAWKRQHR